jgi:competence protein ComFC
MKLAEFLGQIFFPRSCIACKIPLKEGVICSPCLAAIPLHQTLFCATCGARLPQGKKTCHKDALCIIGGAGDYSDPALRELILWLKFKGVREAAAPLAELTANYLLQSLVACHLPAPSEVEGSPVTLIIPVPLSKRRHNERGFNQAEEIARQLSMTMDMTIMTNVFTRARNTKPQTEMNGVEERLKNLHDCFRAAPDVAGKNILLIDDVVTSGATFREAARALKIAGARTIVAVAAAKA